MTNKPRSKTIIHTRVPSESQDLNAPKVKRLSIEDYHDKLASDEQEKRGGWFDENKDYFSEKGKA